MTEGEPDDVGKPGIAGESRAGTLLEVSPALFDMVTMWSSEGGHARGSDAGDAKASTADFTAFVRRNAPALVPEARKLAGRLAPNSKEVHDKSMLCVCRLVAAVASSPSEMLDEDEHHREMRRWPHREQVKSEYRWSAIANGAAHRGELYRYIHHGLTGYERHRQNHTQMRVQMLCQDRRGYACAGHCEGELYLYSEYGSRYHGRAESGGVWDRGAHVSVADGAALRYTAPYSHTRDLFEKVGALSHYARRTAFDRTEVANLVRDALDVGQALATGGVGEIEPDLVSELIHSFAGLVDDAGTNGATETEMFVSHDATRSGAIPVAFSSTSHQVHTIELTSQAAVKNRGWGGRSKGMGRYASAYLLAAALDHFQCDGSVASPTRGALWRYASTPGAPYTEASLQAMTEGFFQVLGLDMGLDGRRARDR